ncbi:MAG TPA: hypothetical protein VK427_03880, partial [Kofleriaceae bacterium]|nr:hypothetical protein [Kofleriaceae bacterium]
MAVSHSPNQLIPGFLGRVRALLYRHEARRALLYGVAALVGLAVVLPLVGSMLAGSRATAIALLSAGCLVAGALVIAALVVGFVVPRRRFSDDAAVARWVGVRQPSIASDLLSAVELARAPARPGAPSPELVDALIASTGRRLDRVEPTSLFDRAEHTRAWKWIFGACAVNALFIVAMPSVIGRGWRSLVLSPVSPFDGAALSDVPLVADLEATLEFPAYSKRAKLTLPSSSGDVRGLPGTAVTLRARVLQPSRSAELFLETEGAAPQKLEAKLEGDQLTARLVISASMRYRFALLGQTGQRSIETTPRMIEAEPDQAPMV